MGNGAIKATEDIAEAERASVFGGEPPSLEAIAKIIREGRAKNIVVLCGAGASVSAGIPDFRTPGTGLYDNLQKYDLPDGKPESVFDLEFFREKPAPFYALAKVLYPGAHAPTLTHRFLRLLHEKGVLRRVYTQNIDGLDYLAGLPADVVVQCHGGFDRAHCIECGADADATKVRDAIFAGCAQDPTKMPRCEREGCAGLCKPRITFFGEKLGPRFSECRELDFYREEDGRPAEMIEQHAESKKRVSHLSTAVAFGLGDAEELAAEKAKCEAAEAERRARLKVSCACDLLLVFGTSLRVQPVAGQPDDDHWLVPPVLVNQSLIHN